MILSLLGKFKSLSLRQSHHRNNASDYDLKH